VKVKFWWIKERDNPQLGTYYVACGQLSKAEAKLMESSLYGSNYMHQFPNEESYIARIAQLKERGEKVQ
jgi:hypothetical protein